MGLDAFPRFFVIYDHFLKIAMQVLTKCTYIKKMAKIAQMQFVYSIIAHSLRIWVILYGAHSAMQESAPGMRNGLPFLIRDAKPCIDCQPHILNGLFIE